MVAAFVACSATSAVVSATALAQFEAESAPVTLTVSSNGMQKFAPGIGTTPFECTTVAVDSSTLASTAATTVTVAPTYSNCENYLGRPTSITTNGCQYVFHLAKGSTTGTVDISCPSGKEIEVKSDSLCTYDIPSQTGLGSVAFKNLGAGTTREVVVELSLTGITSTRINHFGFCPAAGNTGTYTGSFTLTGENGSGSHIGIFVD